MVLRNLCGLCKGRRNCLEEKNNRLIELEVIYVSLRYNIIKAWVRDVRSHLFILIVRALKFINKNLRRLISGLDMGFSSLDLPTMQHAQCTLQTHMKISRRETLTLVPNDYFNIIIIQVDVFSVFNVFLITLPLRRQVNE